jgi:hypothetical protein
VRQSPRGTDRRGKRVGAGAADTDDSLTMDGSIKVVIVPDHATWLRIPLAPAH